MTPIYTLLIVESPVIARIIQKLVPSSVYVIATGGYCWKPKFDPITGSIKPIADPALASIRKELKEQSKWAGTVIVATDSDPSGDFIAWSIARFLKTKTVKRGKIRNLSKKSILAMLEEVQEIDTEQLEFRLKNRFLIRHEWYQQKSFPEMELAGLISLFSDSPIYRHFLDENHKLFQSSVPISAPPDEWISLSRVQDEKKYHTQKPLSLYDIIPSLVDEGICSSYTDAQNGLQRLFETILPDSQASLISYPRTEAMSFYSETWDTLNLQYLKTGSRWQVKPTFLRETADPEMPHESIHPLHLEIHPENIQNKVHREIYLIYSFIFNKTIDAIKLPAPLETAWFNELNPETYFYPITSAETSFIPDKLSLRPCITLSDTGKMLDNLGVLKPSGFASSIETWINNGWVTISNGVLSPGKKMVPHLANSEIFHNILQELHTQSNTFELTSETIRAIFTSN